MRHAGAVTANVGYRTYTRSKWHILLQSAGSYPNFPSRAGFGSVAHS